MAAGAGCRRIDGETAGVGKDVQHLLPGGEGGGAHAGAVGTLVEVEACFVPTQQIYGKIQPIFADEQRCGRRTAPQQTVDRFQALFGAHAGVGTLNDTGGAQFFGQQVGQQGFAPVYAGCQTLQHQVIAVLIHDEAGQAIGLGVNEAIGGRGRFQRQCLPHGDGPAQTTLPEVRANGFVGVPGEDAGANLGVGVGVGGSEVTAVGRDNRYQIARLDTAVGPLDGPREDPRMALLHRLFTAGLENDAAGCKFCRHGQSVALTMARGYGGLGISECGFRSAECVHCSLFLVHCFLPALVGIIAKIDFSRWGFVCRYLSSGRPGLPVLI